MKEFILAPVSARESVHLLGGLIQTRERLLELMAALEDEDLHKKIDKFPTIAEYALHTAQVEWWWNHMVLRDEGISEEAAARFYFTEIETLPLTEKLEKSYILSRLGEARMQTREFYYDLSDQELHRADLTVKDGKKSELYAPDWVLYHLLNHESYHIGQMYMLRSFITGQQDKGNHFNPPHLSMK